MKDLSKWLNPRAAIGSLLSAVVLLNIAGGIVSCTPGGDEGAREANEDVEEGNEEADENDGNDGDDD